MAIERFKLRRVHYMPAELEAGVLYVSDEFEVAGHLCACGCGNKVMLPLGSEQWSVQEVGREATVRPSIGSWQLPCRSHYWITAGAVVWSGQWTPEQIERGRRDEERRLRAHFEARKARKQGWLSAIWGRVKAVAKRVLPWW